MRMLIAILFSIWAIAASAQSLPEKLFEAAQSLTGMQAPAPKFEMMTTAQMAEDACVHPEKCPTLASIHPPLTDRVIINSESNSLDLNIHAQIVHVLVMYLMEQNGHYHPNMSCTKVAEMEAHASVISAQYIVAALEEYREAGMVAPPMAKLQVMMFCTPDLGETI